MAAKMNIGTVLVKLLLDDGNFGPDVDKAEKAISSFGKTAVDLAGTIDKYLTRAFMAAASAVAALGTAAAVTGAAFEKQMSRVAAISGATAEEMAALTEEARRIGSETLFSATQAAEGMEALAQAGFTPRQIITATADAMNLAGASGMELNRATELVAATLTQFSMDAEEAGHVTDVLTQAASSSLFTMEDLAVAMRYAGAAGASMGYSLEETTAAVAQFRNAGLTGEQAGTNFRGMLEAIANPTNKAREAIAELGLTVDDLNPMMRSFDEIMQTLHDSNMNVSQSFRIFGTVSGANVARLAEQWDEAKKKQTGYTQTLNALMNSQGVAAAQFGQMADNVAGRFDKLSSSIEEGLLVIFDAMRGPLVRLMDGLNDRVAMLTKRFVNSSGEVQDGLDRLVDGILALVDQIIILSPYVDDLAGLMFAALVGAKGVQWANAAAQLASVLGVDVAGGAMKAVVAIRAMSAASALMSLTAVGAVLAGLAAITVAVTKLWGQFTGAARAARELAGEIAAREALTATAKEEQAEIGRYLEAQQEEIRFRAQLGIAITEQEQRILRLTAATAAQAKANGELLYVGEELRFLSDATVQQKEDEIVMLNATADAANASAKRLKFLADSYFEAGLGINFDTINDSVNRNIGVIRKANEEFGTQFETLEDLISASEQYAEKANQATDTAKKMRAAMVDETLATQELASSTNGLADAVDNVGDSIGDAKDKVGDDPWKNLRDDLVELQALLPILSENIARDVQKVLDRVLIQQTRDAIMEAVQVDSITPDMFKGAGDELNKIIEQSQEQLAAPSFFQKFGDKLGEAVVKAAKKFGIGLMLKAKNFTSDIFASIGGALMGGLGSVSGISGLVDSIITGQDSAAGDTAAAKQALRQARRSGSRKDIRAAERGLATAKEAESGVTGRSLVNEAIDAAIAFIETLADELPAILDQITKRIPDVVDALVAAIPRVVQAVVAALPGIIDALMGAIPKLIGAVQKGIIAILINAPQIINAILRQIPHIVTAFTLAIPNIITALVGSIPRIIAAVIRNLPAIASAFIALIPRIVVGVIREIMSGDFFEALWKGFKKLAKDFGKSVLEYLTLGIIGGGLFKKQPNRDKTGVAGLFQDIGNLFRRNRGRNPDGIPYVPHTMNTVLEPGEAVLTAMDNWERRRTNMNAPGPLPRGGASGGGVTQVVVAFEGRAVDAAQSRAMADGRMPKVRRALRSASGTRIGFTKGPLSTR